MCLQFFGILLCNWRNCWRSNNIHFQGIVLLFKFLDYFVRSFRVACYFKKFRDYRNFVAFTKRCFRTSHSNLHCWRGRRNSVLRMCPTEIPGVSGEMGRRPIRETRLIGIPLAAWSRCIHVSVQEPFWRHGATRHVHHRRRSFSRFATHLGEEISRVVPTVWFCSRAYYLDLENYIPTRR